MVEPAKAHFSVQQELSVPANTHCSCTTGLQGERGREREGEGEEQKGREREGKSMHRAKGKITAD
jgi:hypothetical protein